MKFCVDCKNVQLLDSRSKRCKSCSKKGGLNPMYGKKPFRSEESRNKIKIKQMGANNSNWKGDNIRYNGIHAWVNRYKIKPIKCESCHKEKRLDLANISQEYKRELSDWEYICRRCHMVKDGRLSRRNNKIYTI